jgi:hypothetical protein
MNLQLEPAMTAPVPGSSTQEEPTSAGPVTAAPAPRPSALEGSTPAESVPGADAMLPDLPPPELQQTEAGAGGEEQVGVPVAAPTDGTGEHPRSTRRVLKTFVIARTHQTPPEEAARTSRGSDE